MIIVCEKSIYLLLINSERLVNNLIDKFGVIDKSAACLLRLRPLAASIGGNGLSQQARGS